MSKKSTADEGRGRPNIQAWGLKRTDHGYVYIFRHNNRFKIGKTTNPGQRIRDARTWIPDIEVVAIKPFWGMSYHERKIHTGLAQFWQGGEWFEFPDDSYSYFFDEFSEFYDDDPDWNSIDFIYWYNGSGMVELEIEQAGRKISLRKWLRTANG